MNVNLPNSDDVLERHQFYSAIHAQQGAILEDLSRQHTSVHRIHERMDTMQVSHQNVREEISKQETRNKTLAQVVVVIWILISGLFGWLWDKSASQVATYIAKIERVEKLVEDLKRDNDKLMAEANQVPILKRRVEAMQKDIDDHIAALEAERRKK